MTSREEIERLLNQTGRTLEGLPEEHTMAERIDAAHRIKACPTEIICHQSDVIELLVGALRDALDKPMQKPLTVEELMQLGDVYVWEERRAVVRSYFMKSPAAVLATILDVNKDDDFYRYGHEIRAWRQMPSDEEMEAAAWQS